MLRLKDLQVCRPYEREAQKVLKEDNPALTEENILNFVLGCSNHTLKDELIATFVQELETGAYIPEKIANQFYKEQRKLGKEVALDLGYELYNKDTDKYSRSYGTPTYGAWNSYHMTKQDLIYFGEDILCPHSGVFNFKHFKDFVYTEAQLFLDIAFPTIKYKEVTYKEGVY